MLSAAVFRLCLAVMHFNENSNRPQQLNASGKPVYSLKFPKFKHGGHTVRRVPVKQTFAYLKVFRLVQ